MRWSSALVVTIATSIVMSAPALADPDTDFANELHTYGIYGQRDYHAWIANITCERMDRGVDKNAYASAEFVGNNLVHGTSTRQAWQFLAAALRTYCPDNLVYLDVATR